MESRGALSQRRGVSEVAARPALLSQQCITARWIPNNGWSGVSDSGVTLLGHQKARQLARAARGKKRKKPKSERKGKAKVSRLFCSRRPAGVCGSCPEMLLFFIIFFLLVLFCLARPAAQIYNTPVYFCFTRPKNNFRQRASSFFTRRVLNSRCACAPNAQNCCDSHSRPIEADWTRRRIV